MRPFISTLILFSALFILSCGEDNNAGVVIQGTIPDAQNMQVFLDQVKLGNSTMVIDQTDTDQQGKFAFQFEEKLPPAVYRLRIGARKALMVFDGSESEVNFNGKLNTFNKYQFDFTGSESAQDFYQAMRTLHNAKMDMQGMTQYLEESENPLSAMQYALMTFQNRPDFYEIHKDVLTRMQSEYPDNPYTEEYTQFVKRLEVAYARKMARERIKVGQPAPDITMAGPDGEEYSLSDLKGKVVLLDFWASWCGPCRRENPKVVKIYQKYKDQGFTVFSVSLDGLDQRTKNRIKNPDVIEKNMQKSKKSWLAAIEKDKLEWEYHVSDLQKWDTPAAKMYGVSGIPKTFLIDRDGKIAAINPRHNLEKTLVRFL